MIKSTIKRGADFLAREQQPDGGFASLSSTKKHSPVSGKLYQTSFFPALILSALNPVDEAVIIKQKLYDYLIAQKSQQWSFNYWQRSSLQAKRMPYPDDLDDTFCALSALYLQKPELFDGKALAAITQLLIKTEVAEGGPYKTWLVSDTAPVVWQDVDIAVNANVAYFLALQDVTLPNLTAYFENRLAQGDLGSQYYPSATVPAYFIARWYAGKQVPRLTKILQAKTSSPLKIALQTSSLIRLGYPLARLDKRIQAILQSQLPDGSWPADAFCIDPSLRNITHYASSSSLTTAFCLEALSLYDHAVSQAPVARPKPNILYKNVTDHVRGVIETIAGAELRTHTLMILDRTIQNDTDQQIVLLPQLVAKMADTKIQARIVRQLAAASLWGWMAYTIYDDFLDYEGDIKLLPSANVCLRNLVKTLESTLPNNTAFQQEVTTIMDRLDAANAWEVSNCRAVVTGKTIQINSLPDYGNYWQLADRSLGHTIAGLGVLYASGAGNDRLQALRNFFKHYLIARQLNDDAHDWEEDLRRGHINAVGKKILESWRQLPGKSLASLNLDKEQSILRTIMWQSVIDSVCSDIYKHTRLARRALKPKTTGYQTELVEGLLQTLETSAEQAMQNRNQAQDFIANLT